MRMRSVAAALIVWACADSALACLAPLDPCPYFRHQQREALAVFVALTQDVQITNDCVASDDPDCIDSGVATVVVRNAVKGGARARTTYRLPVSLGTAAGCGFGYMPRAGERVVVHVVRSAHDGVARYEVSNFADFAAKRRKCRL